MCPVKGGSTLFKKSIQNEILSIYNYTKILNRSQIKSKKKDLWGVRGHGLMCPK